MCMYDDGDGWKVFRSESRTARKAYRCCECGRDIVSGERYEYATGVLNGEDYWLTMRTCAHCAAGPYGWLGRVCGGWLYEGAYEDLDEHRHEPDVRDIALYRNLIGMRRRWRRRDGTLMEIPAALATVQAPAEPNKADRIVAAHNFLPYTHHPGCDCVPAEPPEEKPVHRMSEHELRAGVNRFTEDDPPPHGKERPE